MIIQKSTIAIALFILSVINLSSQTTYFSNGQIHTTGDKQNGEYIEYFAGGTQIMVKCNYLNGKKHGEYYSYNANGKLSGLGKYKKGEKVGEWLLWGLGGKLAHVSYYKNGKQNGMELDIFPDGQMIRTNYLNDVREGECIVYDAKGRGVSLRY